VQFLDSSTVIGTAAISGGAAALTISTLVVGTHPIAAAYAGDANITGSLSNTLNQTVNAVVPGPPANLTAAAASSSQINLTWTASPTPGALYNVYASTTSGFVPSPSNRVAAGLSATAYSHTGLAASTTYYYRVTAQNSAGESAASNQASATTSAAALACHVDYSVSTQWNVGFTAAVSIKNTGTRPINGWTLTWTWSGNQQIYQAWNSNYTQSGANATLTNANWNQTIAPGATLTGAGFNASYSGSNPAPTAFFINGTRCQ